MRWLQPHLQEFWRDTRSSIQREFSKWMFIQLGGATVMTPYFQSLPWWSLTLHYVGTILVLFLISSLLFRRYTIPALSIRGIPTYVTYKQTGEAASCRSDCEIEIQNTGDKTIEQLTVEVTAIELPSGLKAPTGFKVDLASNEDREARLLPGDKMSFVLLRDAWRADAFGKQAVVAKAVGNWGGVHVFILGQERQIRIKAMGDNIPPVEKTYNIIFPADDSRFVLARV